MRNLTWCLVMLFALAGCDDDGGDGGGADAGGDADIGSPLELEIYGTWVDPFATEHIINMDAWVQTADGNTSTYAIIDIDARSNTIIAENDAANMFAPGKFSRFDWTSVGSRLFFCQSAFDKDSAEEAANAEAADAADPTTGGCGGMFPWSELLTP